MTYSLDAAPAVPPAPVATSPSPMGPLPTIIANRRRLDNRFPVLGFTIRTLGRPYFEVLLTTERALFDAANASRRTPANFYAGRQDGGLARAGTDETAYIVPAVVLRRFADARPRPSEIFFTVAVYDTPEGPPTLAHPPQVLATTAPSVLLGSDFHAQTLAVVLGVPAEKLRPAHEVHAAGYATATPAPGELDDDGYPTGEAMTWSSEEDEAWADAQAADAWLDDPQAMALDADEPAPAYPPGPSAYHAYGDPGPTEEIAAAYSDEDIDVDTLGYGDAHGAPYNGAPGRDDDIAESYEDELVNAYGEDVADAYGDQDEAYPDDEPAKTAQSYAYDALPAAGERPHTEGDEAGAFIYEDGFEDGHDDVPGTGQAAWAEAEESVFPAGAAEPATLADEGEDRYEAELAATEAYDAHSDEHGHLPYDDMAAYEAHASGNGAAPVAAPPAPPAAQPLDIPAKIAIVTKLGRLFESPDGFSAVALDPHVGLRAGFVGFHGRLLQHLLRLMRQRDAATFRTVLGTDADILPTTEDSVLRLRSAGAHPPFQAAQNELAVRAFLDPILVFGTGFGLDTERALAMLADRAMQMGPRGALRWLAEAIGPIRTDAQRQQALGALGFPGVAEFQRAAGVRRDGDFGPSTQTAMVGALRRLGAASPVPIPTREQLMDAIVARADAQAAPWHQRPRMVRTSPEFGDVPLTWAPPISRRT